MLLASVILVKTDRLIANFKPLWITLYVLSNEKKLDFEWKNSGLNLDVEKTLKLHQRRRKTITWFETSVNLLKMLIWYVKSVTYASKLVILTNFEVNDVYQIYYVYIKTANSKGVTISYKQVWNSIQFIQIITANSGKTIL